MFIFTMEGSQEYVENAYLQINFYFAQQPVFFLATASSSTQVSGIHQG